MKLYHYVLLAIPILIYLFLRLEFREVIEFGYDQPRLSSRVIQFIKDGEFLNTQKYAERSPWGNISWGPSLFIFFAPFFLISKNPITLSLLISAFNLISVLLVLYIGLRYFSIRTGFVAGMFLATMPWWWIFSRMIYQPTPVPTIVVAMIFLTFKVLDRPKSFYIAPLVFCWGFLIELYFHTFSAIAVSALAITSRIRKLDFAYLFLGIVATSFLFIPYFKVHSIDDYLPKNDETITWIQTRDAPLNRIKNIVPHYIQIISGGDFSWQLGKGYEDFRYLNPGVEKTSLIISVLTVVVLFYNLFLLLISTKKRVHRIALILWTIAPIPFLVFIRLPSVPPIPRYFLLSLPSLCLLWGIAIDDMAIRITHGKKIVAILLTTMFLFIPTYWFFFNIRYYKFVANYSYPNGPLSTYSDIPYSFLTGSIDFVLKDAGPGFSVVISNDANNTKQYALDWATGYVWDNVYKKDRDIKDTAKVKYYLITTSDEQKDNFVKIYRSGPYSVFKVVDL